MANRRKKPETPKPVQNAGERLIEFYSNRVESIRAKYRAHELMLGETTHHLPTGTRCERLIRKEIRRVLRPGLVAEFGYVFGRTERDGRDEHSPEVDILIYDETRVKPVLRDVGLVHVLPESVRGIVQVKKKLTNAALVEGIKNVATTKQHIIAGIQARRHQRFPVDRVEDIARIFSAVIGIVDDLSEESKSVKARFSRALCAAAKRYAAFVPSKDRGLAISMLPQFVGSLDGYLAWSNPQDLDVFVVANGHHVFEAGRASYEGKLLGLQAFLFALCRVLLDPATGIMQPFELPRNVETFGFFPVPARFER